MYTVSICNHGRSYSSVLFQCVLCGAFVVACVKSYVFFSITLMLYTHKTFSYDRVSRKSLYCLLANPISNKSWVNLIADFLFVCLLYATRDELKINLSCQTQLNVAGSHLSVGTDTKIRL